MNSQTMNSHPMTTRAKSRKFVIEKQTRIVEYTLRTFNLFKMRIFSMVSAMIMGYALFVLKMPIVVKILNVCYLTSAVIIMKNVDKEYYSETDVDNQILMWLIQKIFGKKVAIIEEEEEDDYEDDDCDTDSDEDYIPGEDEDPYRKRRVRKLPVKKDEYITEECDEAPIDTHIEYDLAEDVEESTDEDTDEDSDEDYVPGEDENPYRKKRAQKVCVENIAKQTEVDEKTQDEVDEKIQDEVVKTPEENINIRNVSDDYVLAEM